MSAQAGCVFGSPDRTLRSAAKATPTPAMMIAVRIGSLLEVRVRYGDRVSFQSIAAVDLVRRQGESILGDEDVMQLVALPAGHAFG
jgi:hypothetical protein